MQMVDYSEPKEGQRKHVINNNHDPSDDCEYTKTNETWNLPFWNWYSTNEGPPKMHYDMRYGGVKQTAEDGKEGDNTALQV